MAEDYESKSFWLATSGPYQESPPLDGDLKCDVAVVGGGFAGVATAYFLKKAEPSLNVVVLEGEVIGFGASGRNAGFAMTTFGLMMSVTKALFGPEKTRQSHHYMERAVDLVGELVAEHSLDCEYERTGFLRVATTPAYIRRIKAEVKLTKSLGLEGIDWIDAEAVRARVNSPLYLGAWWEPWCVLLNPARLVREMKRVAMKFGAQFYERTPVTEIHRHADIFHLKTPRGSVTAGRLALTTNAYSLSIHQLRRKQVPVWTYIVLTEPIKPGRLVEIGWKGREGVEDYRDFVHYYRLTAENRLLLGGRDVKITFGGNMDRDFDDRIFTNLEDDIVAFFPSLKGVKITHRWGGPVSVPIDLTPALGYLGDHRAVYSLGCMGHGVSLMHLNGQVLADLLLERKTQWTESFPVGRQVIPWPPEPIRYVISQAILSYMHVEDVWAERKGLGAQSTC